MRSSAAFRHEDHRAAILNLSSAPARNSMRRGGHSYPALGTIGEVAYAGLVLLVVFVALIFGGGTRQGLWSDALAQIVSLPLLAVAFFRLKALPSSQLRLPLFLIFAAVVVPVLQLVPLPPQVWTILPGRAEVAEAFRAAGMSLPFLPISLEPLTTLRSVFSLLPAVAVFLGVFCLRRADRIPLGSAAHFFGRDRRSWT